MLSPLKAAVQTLLPHGCTASAKNIAMLSWTVSLHQATSSARPCPTARSRPSLRYQVLNIFTSMRIVLPIGPHEDYAAGFKAVFLTLSSHPDFVQVLQFSETRANLENAIPDCDSGVTQPHMHTASKKELMWYTGTLVLLQSSSVFHPFSCVTAVMLIPEFLRVVQ